VARSGDDSLRSGRRARGRRDVHGHHRGHIPGARRQPPRAAVPLHVPRARPAGAGCVAVRRLAMAHAHHSLQAAARRPGGRRAARVLAAPRCERVRARGDSRQGPAPAAHRRRGRALALVPGLPARYRARPAPRRGARPGRAPAPGMQRDIARPGARRQRRGRAAVPVQHVRSARGEGSRVHVPQQPLPRRPGLPHVHDTGEGGGSRASRAPRPGGAGHRQRLGRGS